MVRALFTSASGMTAQQAHMDTISHNLANVDTPGFKHDIAAFKAFPEMMMARKDDDGVVILPIGSYDIKPYIGRLGTGVEVNEVYTEFSQGSLKGTENALDFALEGKGFFAVETPKGERYTRNGSFLIDKESYIVTKDGYRVLGENGPIQLKANNFQVNKQGVIYVNEALQSDPERLVQMRENDWQDGAVLDAFKLVRFEKERFLKKEGESLWADTDVSGPAYIAEIGGDRPETLQGFIETSNVNAVSEMVKMIEVQRSYELNSRSIQTADTLLGKAVNDVGRYV